MSDVVAYQREFYDRHFARRAAAVREQLAHPLFCSFNDRLARRAFDLAGLAGRGSARVLEVGCGEGLLADAIRPQLPDARVVVELGRYIVGECGFYVTRVVDRKESRGKTFLVVDGGMHHQLAASGNFGQVIRRNYPVAIANRGDEATETATVVGCLCTPLDLLADGATLPRADIGDLVVVFQAGAYGLTASPTAFLSHPAPVEVLV
jgi:hypothetical protein